MSYSHYLNLRIAAPSTMNDRTIEAPVHMPGGRFAVVSGILHVVHLFNERAKPESRLAIAFPDLGPGSSDFGVSRVRVFGKSVDDLEFVTKHPVLRDLLEPTSGVLSAQIRKVPGTITGYRSYIRSRIDGAVTLASVERDYCRAQRKQMARLSRGEPLPNPLPPFPVYAEKRLRPDADQFYVKVFSQSTKQRFSLFIRADDRTSEGPGHPSDYGLSHSPSPQGAQDWFAVPHF